MNSRELGEFIREALPKGSGFFVVASPPDAPIGTVVKCTWSTNMPREEIIQLLRGFLMQLGAAKGAPVEVENIHENN